MRQSREEEFAAFFDVASPRLLSVAWLLTGEQHAAEEGVAPAVATVVGRLADLPPQRRGPTSKCS